MTEIKVLGTGTSKHQMVTSVVKEYLAKAGIDILVNDYTDVDAFLKEGIESIPALVYKGKVYNVGSNGDFNKSLRVIVNTILRDFDYGDLAKIIIPVDFSNVSTNAFAYGHRLATDLGAITKAVHAYYPSAREVTEASVVNVDFEKLRASYLDDFVDTFDTDWGSDLMKVSLIDSEFRNGFPGEEILESISTNSAFLTIMGTTGQTGLIKKWFGSVSHKVMNESSLPVLIIPENANYKGIKKIAYAFEGTAQDRLVMKQLATIARKFLADVHLIHVQKVGDNPDPGFFLTGILERYYPSVKIFTSTIQSDDVTKSITDYCNSEAIDVISLSTHKKGVFERLYDDNISQQLTAMSAIPLLVLKPTDEQ